MGRGKDARDTSRLIRPRIGVISAQTRTESMAEEAGVPRRETRHKTKETAKDNNEVGENARAYARRCST